jgi:hypothetical protein
VEVLVVVAIVGMLAGMLLPAVSAAREAARRVQCRSHQRQIGLGVLGFEAAWRVFPASGWTRPGPGNPDGTALGWRTAILPYLEQVDVRSLYDTRQHWWQGTNLAVASIPVPIYVCPSTPPLEPVLRAIAKAPRPALTVTLPLAGVDYEAIQGCTRRPSTRPGTRRALGSPSCTATRRLARRGSPTARHGRS